MSPRVPVLACCVAVACAAAAYRGLAPHASPPAIGTGGANASSRAAGDERASALETARAPDDGGLEPAQPGAPRRRGRRRGDRSRAGLGRTTSPACPTLALGGGGATAPRGPADGCERVVVYVAGAVVRPGLYAVAATGRAADAVGAAGGATAGADMVGVNLAQRVADGDEIAVPDLADAAPARTTRARGSRASSARRTRRPRALGSRRGRTKRGTGGRRRAGAGAADAPIAPVDLNAATPEALETLPGVGAVLADRIVAFRELNGPYAAPSELLDVEGVTDAKLAAMADYLVVR